jgi:hypothetical protein
MVENLADHGVQPSDLIPALMTTHTVANPEYDPAAAERQAEVRREEADALPEPDDISEITMVEPTPSLPPKDSSQSAVKVETFQTTSRILETTSTAAVPGVSTSLSAADEKVTLDIRWTVLCDLFLVLIADSVYDARSRVLLETVAIHLGFGWLDVVKFEQRVSEALEIQEDVEKMEQQDVIASREKSSRRRRYMMVGLATLGRVHSPPSDFVHTKQRDCNRRWAGHWAVSGFACTSDRGWPGCSLHNCWHIRDGRLPRWRRRCCNYYDWWRPDRVRHSCHRHGAEN